MTQLNLGKYPLVLLYGLRLLNLAMHNLQLFDKQQLDGEVQQP